MNAGGITGEGTGCDAGKERGVGGKGAFCIWEGPSFPTKNSHT